MKPLQIQQVFREGGSTSNLDVLETLASVLGNHRSNLAPYPAPLSPALVLNETLGDFQIVKKSRRRSNFCTRCCM